MEGPLEEGHVAQDLEIAARGRVALQPASPPRQQDETGGPTIPAATSSHWESGASAAPADSASSVTTTSPAPLFS